ncbi:MAG TPA: hypothetical protein VIP55_04690, partial [Agromyces sp.]
MSVATKPRNNVPDHPSTPTRPGVVTRVLATVGVQNISLLIAIALVVTVIGTQNPLFFTAGNMRVIGTAIAISGLLAVVQTMVIIMGGLDISVGSIAGLTSVTSAMIFTVAGPALGVV